MLRLLPFKKSSHQSYSVSDSSFLVHVKLLDGSVVDLSLPVETTGGECLDRVAAYLNLRETDYFGLQFQSRNGDIMRWVEREAVLKKHFVKYGRVAPVKSEADLVFGVQYFTNNIGALTDEIARYLFYLELRRDILQGQLPCPTNMAFKLASFALQADLGDFSPERHTREFIEDIDLIPEENLQTQNIHEVGEKVKKLYQRNKGLSSDGAIVMYLKSAMQLSEYGHQGFEALDGRGNRIRIGTCFVGMFVKHYNARPAIYFRWPDILQMKVKDKNLAIETASEEILFKMEDKELAKYALRQMSTQHQFYSQELRKAGQRNVRSRSVEPALHRHREPVVTQSRPCETPTGSPQKKKGKFQSHKVAEPRLDVRPLTPEITNVFTAVERVAVPPQASAHPSHTHTADVEVHAHDQLPVSRRPESPKKEGPIQKLVTVVRRESSKRATAHQIEDANFADIPSHDEEIPVTQEGVKVSPMISKYVPRNLRESLSVNGISEKGTNLHPPFFGLSRDQWSDHKELDLSSIAEPATAVVLPPLEVREEHAAEMQIDLGSTSSQSGSVSPMSVPVTVREGGAELEQALPQLHDANKFESPQFTKHVHATESSALLMDDSDKDAQQAVTLATSRAESQTLEMVEEDHELKLDVDTFGPPMPVPIADEVTESAEVSFSDDDRGEEGFDGEEEKNSSAREEVERDTQEDSDTDIDLQDTDDDSEEEKEDEIDRPPPSSLPLHPEPRFTPLGTHLIIDNPNDMEEVEFVAPGNKDKLVEMLEDKLQSGSLIREYARIPKTRVDAKVSSATSSRNIYRNRYRDILPYDDNRVQLNPSNNLANADYINASYITFTTGDKSKHYIMCQGPLPHTCTDFWQMIWEHTIQCVVMVTNSVEAGRQKCHQYFPLEEGEQVQFEQYRITCTKMTGEQVVCTRELQLRHIPSGRVLDLFHLHLTDWPDHGAPSDPSSFVELMRQMRHFQSSLPPDAMTAVHCSAGVGRSGVAVLMDLLIERFSQSLDVDIQKSLRELRKQRMHLVQTPVQYVFVHHALLEYLQTLQGGSGTESDC